MAKESFSEIQQVSRKGALKVLLISGIIIAILIGASWALMKVFHKDPEPAPPPEVTAPPAVPTEIQYYDASKEETYTTGVDYVVITKDGRRIRINADGSVVLVDEDGRPIRVLSGEDRNSAIDTALEITSFDSAAGIALSGLDDVVTPGEAEIAEKEENPDSIDARLTKVLEGKGLTIEDFYGYVYDSGTTPSAFMRIAEGYDGNLERLVNLTIEAAEENAPDSGTPTMSAGIENVNIAEPQSSSSDDSYPDWLQPVDPSASMNALMNALGAASGTVSDTALSWEAVNQNESQQSWLDEQQSGPVTASRIDKWYLAAGTVVPITIVTGIDTDLPGDVVGVVRQNVYDTLTGRNLLIPKGSRLIATYNNSVAFGQKSVQIAWNQLILPDGYVFTLPGFQGITGEGYAGSRDRYNSHFWEMLGGALLGTIIDYSTGYVADQAELASEVITGSDILSVLANSALGTSQSYMEDWIQLFMNRQPTIKIRPGYQTQLLVNQNISLRR